MNLLNICTIKHIINETMVTAKEFKARLRNQEQIIGTWITCPSPHSLDAICRSQIDFVILDQEHGSITSSDLLPLINTAIRHNTVPIVRPSNIDLQLCQTALDSGALFTIQISIIKMMHA